MALEDKSVGQNPDQPFRSLSEVFATPPQSEWTVRNVMFAGRVAWSNPVPFRAKELSHLDKAYQLVSELSDPEADFYNRTIESWLRDRFRFPEGAMLEDRAQAIRDIHAGMGEIADAFNGDPSHYLTFVLDDPRYEGIKKRLIEIMSVLKYFWPQEPPRKVQVNEGGEFPENQTREEKTALLASLKTGDMLHAVLNRGTSQERFYREHHVTGQLPDQIQVHGAVSNVIPEDDAFAPAIEVFGPWFSMIAAMDSDGQSPFRDSSSRTFTLDDIDVLVIDRAEKFIPMASDGEFFYGSPATATVTLPEGGIGTELIVVDTYIPVPGSSIEAFVGGYNAQGVRVTSPKRWVKPLKK